VNSPLRHPVPPRHQIQGSATRRALYAEVLRRRDWLLSQLSSRTLDNEATHSMRKELKANGVAGELLELVTDEQLAEARRRWKAKKLTLVELVEAASAAKNGGAS
jgi:hypothetical protein